MAARLMRQPLVVLAAVAAMILTAFAVTDWIEHDTGSGLGRAPIEHRRRGTGGEDGRGV